MTTAADLFRVTDTVALTRYAHRRRGPNSPPGQPGHDHWGSPRPADVHPDVWRAYGDRYPGSYCRWASGQDWYCPGAMSGADCAEHRDRLARAQAAAALWRRVHPEAAA
jgi:hypothetical protein